MLEGNRTEYRATDWRTLQLKIFKLQTLTIAAISSPPRRAPAFVQSVFLVAVWDTSTKKIERQTILALEISFFRE
jgi:hypothetical protein